MSATKHSVRYLWRHLTYSTVARTQQAPRTASNIHQQRRCLHLTHGLTAHGHRRGHHETTARYSLYGDHRSFLSTSATTTTNPPYISVASTTSSAAAAATVPLLSSVEDVPAPIRSHYCGHPHNVTEDPRSPPVSLCGWLQSSRVIGDLFFGVLRDYTGTIQVVWTRATAVEHNQEHIFAQLAFTPVESVIAIKGLIQHRPAEMQKPQEHNGTIECSLSSLYILSTSSTTAPFDLQSTIIPSEELRLQYRYLDLRRPYYQHLLRLRATTTLAIRRYLTEHHHFIEVETPLLFKSTPEGAREFLVPTRTSGMFYALPQSPQQHKQLLMCAGIDRYFQLARCFRDEGSRADRQPEFTQLDIEMSFVSANDVMQTLEATVRHIVEVALQHQLVSPFPVMTYSDAMNMYGSDKPDTRYDMPLHDLSHFIYSHTNDDVGHPFQQITAAGGVVKAFCVKGGASMFTRKEMDGIMKDMKDITAVRVQGRTAAEWKMPASLRTLITDALGQSLIEQLSLSGDELLFISAGEWKHVCEALGALRISMAQHCQSKGRLTIDPTVLNIMWIVDFPLFDLTHHRDLTHRKAHRTLQELQLTAMHHPFTAPQARDAASLNTILSHIPQQADHDREIRAVPLSPDLITALSHIRGQHYDLVCNGVELAGGSIRLHDARIQQSVLHLLGADTSIFSALLSALSSGAPPHGGVALGFDRFMALIGAYSAHKHRYQCESSGYVPGYGLPIRDVIAFPKTSTGRDMMADAPAAVSDAQLKEYYIQVRRPS